MNRQRIEDLWSRLLAGEEISETEKIELLRALQEDEALRTEILKDRQIEGLLRVRGRALANSEEFVRTFSRRLAAEEDAIRFVDRVDSRLECEPNRRRVLTSANWRVGLCAAGSLIGVLFLAVLWNSGPRHPVALLEEATGEVYVLSGAGRTGATSARRLERGEGLLTVGDKSRAVVRYADGTRLGLEGDTTVSRLDDGDARKKVFLSRGVLTATVTPQPAGHPMVLITPAAEIAVRGTRFTVLLGEAGSTRVKDGRRKPGEAEVKSIVGVDQGAVQVKRSVDGKAIEVGEGNYAVAAGGVELTPRPLAESLGPVKSTLLGHTAGVWHVAFSPDGRRLATVSDDRSVKLWEPATGREPIMLGKRVEDWYYYSAFSPDGRTLATVAGSHAIKHHASAEVELWDLVTGRGRAVLKGHTDTVWCAAFSPDGRLLATGSRDGVVKLWDPTTGQERMTLAGHAGSVWAVPFSPDGRMLASASADGTVNLWEVATSRLRATLRGHADHVLSAAFSPDGRTLATGSGHDTQKTSPGEVRIWDVETGVERRILRRYPNSVWSVAFSPNGRTLAAGSADGSLTLWDALSWEERTTLQGHPEVIWALAFSPDGRTLATASQDWTIKLWEATRHK